MKSKIQLIILVAIALLIGFNVPQQLFAQTEEEYEKSKKEYEQKLKEFEAKKSETAKTNEAIKEKNKRNTLVNDGFQALRQRQSSKSVRLFNEAIQIDEAFEKAYYGLGLAYSRDSKPREALEAYEKAISLNPNYVTVYVAQGNLLQRLGRRPEAKASFEKAIELEPTNAKALYGSGSIYAKQNRPDHRKAVELFQKAVAEDTKYALAYNALGISQMELGRTTEGVQAFKEATYANPNMADAFYRLSKALNDIGKPREALDAAMSCINIKKGQRRFFAAAHIEAGRAYRDLGNNSLAIQQFELAKKDNNWRDFATYQIEEIKRNQGGSR